MNRRGDRDRLTDILDAASDAQSFISDLDQAAFAGLQSTDRRTYRALKNTITEIGEAVKGLSPELLARHPDVDWSGWAGLRDVVTHQYFQLRLAAIEPALIEELPVLLAAVESELQ